jgi:hypothetical protein
LFFIFKNYRWFKNIANAKKMIKDIKAQWQGDCNGNPFFCFLEKRLQCKAPMGGE